MELTRLISRGARPGNEVFDSAPHLDEVIPKPWGYEYRAFVDEFFDLWTLHIDPTHSTSMHAHPRKLTYLICLAGSGVTQGLRTEFPVTPGMVVRIAPGAFHATQNVGDGQLELIEVEVPRNKLDLIRLRDDYNRSVTAYESRAARADHHPLRRVPYLPNARMRDRTLDGRFRFDLRTGTDLFYRRLPGDVFHIPLCLSGVVASRVKILSPGDGQWPDLEKTYLCVSRSS